MIRAFLKKYLSIVFVLATFMGTFHHSHHHNHNHSDINHNDCQICTIQSNILNADTPPQVNYLDKITLTKESVFTKFATFANAKTHSTLQARAPPKLS